MNLVPEITQPFGGFEQISFGSAIQIQTFMHKSNLHGLLHNHEQRINIRKSPAGSTPSHSFLRCLVLRSSHFANLRSLRVSSDRFTAQTGWRPRRPAFDPAWFDAAEREPQDA